MNEQPMCPLCSSLLDRAFLYVRGISTALFRSSHGDTGLLSRKNLQQIDLDEISTKQAGAQAVIDAWHCAACDAMTFKTSRN